MYFITISESCILFGVCNKQSGLLNISRISKKIITDSANNGYNEKNILNCLIDILTEWNTLDNSANKELYISIPNKWVNIYINNIDKELKEEELIDVLNWNVKMRFGEKSLNHSIQHYPLKSSNNYPTIKYISTTLNKNIKYMLSNLCEEYNYSLKLIDVNLLSAYNILEKTFPVSNYNKFGIWQVADKTNIQNLLLINNNELSLIQFYFDSEKSYRIIQNSSIDSFGEKIVKNITENSQSTGQLDKLFYYTYSPDNDFVKKCIKSNNDLINPFTQYKNQDITNNRLLDNQISKSQFCDLTGLMNRFDTGE